MDLHTGDIAEPAESYAGSLLPSDAARRVQRLPEADAAVKALLELDVAEEFSLLAGVAPAEDQSHRGTCATFAGSLAASFFLKRDLSEQHLYNRAWHRYYGGGASDDEGTSMDAVLSALQEEGTCDASIWDYEPHPIRGNLPQDPVPARAVGAEKMFISGWDALPLPAQQRGELIAKQIYAGRGPVVICMPVIWGGAGWEDGIFIDLPPSGELPPPNSSHAVVAVGYSLQDDFLIIRNSWGQDWGICGTALISFAYLDRYLEEAFVLRGAAE